MRAPDDRPQNWQSPDGRSYWWHYAHEQDRLRHAGQNTTLRVLVYSLFGLLCLFLLWLERAGLIR